MIENPQRKSTGSSRSQQVLVPSSDWRNHMALGWVTASGRALATRVYQPPCGYMNGAVVIAPSFAREAVVSYRSMRALAVAAARSGFLALAFDLSGDGDSEGLAANDHLPSRWVRDLEAVAKHARGLVGEDLPVHLIGFRIGAALLSQLPHTGPGELIAWEPVSGRAFLRAHRLIRQHAVTGDLVPEGVELDGVHFTDEQASSLAELTVSTSQLVGTHWRTRFETDRRTAHRLALGVPYYAHVPQGAIGEIVSSLPRGASKPVPPNDLDASWTFKATTGTEVTERYVEIGPGRLPGIITECKESNPRASVIFTAMGSELRSGPGNLWSKSARALAPLGIRSLRADRTGIGDVADPDRVDEPPPYTSQSVIDLVHAVEVLAEGGMPVIGAGVCAGAWSLLQAAAQTSLDGVLAINVVHWNPDPSVYTDEFYAHYHGAEAPAMHQAGAPTRPYSRLGAQVLASARQTAAARVPRVATLLKRGLPPDRARQLLSPIPDRTSVQLMFGPAEARSFRLKGGPRSNSTTRTQVIVDASLDHSLLSENGRRLTFKVLRERAVSSATPARDDPPIPPTGPSPPTCAASRPGHLMARQGKR